MKNLKLSDQAVRRLAGFVRQSAFMEPQVWEDDFVEIEGSDGTVFVPVDVAGPPLEEYEMEESGETLEDRYGDVYGPGEIYNVEEIHGWGAQMSAPGYLDQTDLNVFDTEEAAIDYLFDMHMADMGELDPEYEEYREEYEEYRNRQNR